MQSRSATSRRLLLAASVSSLVFGCAPLPREPAVPPDYEAEVTVLGLKNIRYWGDEDSPEIIATGKDAYDRELAAWRAAGNDGPLPEADFLAVSGGGEDGAFGAGLLCGWSETGQRPQFKLVTGISTGALTAPFAFPWTSGTIHSCERSIPAYTPAMCWRSGVSFPSSQEMRFPRTSRSDERFAASSRR